MAKVGRPRKERKKCLREECGNLVKHSRNSSKYCSTKCTGLARWAKKTPEEKREWARVQAANANKQANVIRLRARIDAHCNELGIPITNAIYRLGARLHSHAYLSGYHACAYRVRKGLIK